MSPETPPVGGYLSSIRYSLNGGPFLDYFPWDLFQRGLTQMFYGDGKPLLPTVQTMRDIVGPHLDAIGPREYLRIKP